MEQVAASTFRKQCFLLSKGLPGRFRQSGSSQIGQRQPLEGTNPLDTYSKRKVWHLLEYIPLG